jgi:5-methylcytosine-specific restriction endonuclease McrA
MSVFNVCKICSKEFKKRHDSKNIYCSQECAAIGSGIALAEKAHQKYLLNPKHCCECNSIIPFEKRTNKFCCQSCAATHNNKGVRRHGKDKSKCIVCDNPTKSYKAKYCSNKCQATTTKVIRTPEEHRIRRNEVAAAYRARLRNQTPTWADRKAIREFYANCPPGYEVDHIIPISKGGLHILENLQYLTMEENRRKSNKLVDPLGLEPR